MTELVGQAQAAMPDQAPPASWVRNLVSGFGVDWVRAALRRAQQRRKAGAVIGTGYVIGTLKGFAQDGCAPPELLRPAPPPKPKMTHEQWLERVKAHYASKGLPLPGEGR